jgi:hypothetical protein
MDAEQFHEHVSDPLHALSGEVEGLTLLQRKELVIGAHDKQVRVLDDMHMPGQILLHET